MLKTLLRPFAGKKAMYPLFRRLFALSLRGMNIGGGGGVETSGEINAMSYVKEHSSGRNTLTIFDVGANKGQYTKSLLKYC